jgi:dihydroflavonol-4-reductase
MRVFVTGATGLLGNAIVRHLTQAGHSSIALVRRRPDPEVFRDVAVELVQGDLSNGKAIDAAIGVADAVIHCAALIHVGWQNLEQSLNVNRDGTRAVIEAAIRHSKKLVHVGTVNTLAVGAVDAPADETTPLNADTEQIPCSYVVSKRIGVKEVWSGVDRGLRATIVHPGFMLGPWDWKPSSGRMVVELARAWRPLCPSGGCSLCDSRDVAAAAVAAIELGGDDGREYILAGENLSYQRLWSEIARRVGRPAPIMRLGPLLRVGAGVCGDLWGRLRGSEGDVNSAAIRMSHLYSYHDSSRARRELGYTTRPASETLDDAVAWMRHRQRPTDGGNVAPSTRPPTAVPDINVPTQSTL